MRDWVFFPLMLAGMAAMVAASLAPGPARLREALRYFQDPEDGLYLHDDGFEVLQVPEGLSLDLTTLADGREAARLTAARPVDAPPYSQGIFVTLPPSYGAAFAGRTIRISVEARQAPDNGAPRFVMAYFGGGGARNSGWRDFPLGGEWEGHSFEWFVPAETEEDAADFVGIWPDPEGQGRVMELTSLRVELADD